MHSFKFFILFSFSNYKQHFLHEIQAFHILLTVCGRKVWKQNSTGNQDLAWKIPTSLNISSTTAETHLTSKAIII